MPLFLAYRLANLDVHEAARVSTVLALDNVKLLVTAQIEVDTSLPPCSCGPPPEVGERREPL